MQKLKTTSVGIYIGRKLDRDEASKNALLPHVLLKGCKVAPDSAEVAKRLENLYGAKLRASVTKRGDNQFMNFDGEVISDRYSADGEELISGLLDLMLSVVFEPKTRCGAFLGDILEREKKNAIDRVKGLINDKTQYANNRAIEEMFKDDIYSISEWGEVSEIEAIKPKVLFEHYKNVIATSAINIFISGEVDVQKAKDEIEKRVSGLDFKKAELAKTEIPQKKCEKRDITEVSELTQGKLAIGFMTNVSAKDDDFWALVVANNIFGGGMGSKLFNNVREKLSLCYYVKTAIDRPKGYMLLYAGISFDKFKAATDEIFAQLSEMKSGNITDAELANAKSEIANSLNACYDDQLQMQRFYMGNIVSGVDVSIEEYKEKVAMVTKDEVIAVIKKLECDTVYFLRGEE